MKNRAYNEIETDPDWVRTEDIMRNSIERARDRCRERKVKLLKEWLFSCRLHNHEVYVHGGMGSSPLMVRSKITGKVRYVEDLNRMNSPALQVLRLIDQTVQVDGVFDWAFKEVL